MFDTTITNVNLYDTTITNVNLFDTTVTNVNLFDTTVTNVNEYDTTSINLYDTTITNVNLFDTTTTIIHDTLETVLTLYDTIVTSVNVFDTIKTNIVVYDTNLVNVNMSIIDSIYLTGAKKLKVELPQGIQLDNISLGVVLDYIGLKHTDEVSVQLKGMFYDNLGQYVSTFNETLDIDHDGNIQEKFEFIVLEEEDGYLVSSEGRRLGTGVYILNTYVKVFINGKIDETAKVLNSIGHSR